MPRVALTIVIDTDALLGPQVRQARAHGVPWKLLSDMTGRCERQLRRAMSEKTDSRAMSGFSDRQTVSICVLNPAVAQGLPALRVFSLEDTGRSSFPHLTGRTFRTAGQ